MTERKVLARRTLGSGPPPDLLFGEIAYSDGDKQFYVGGPEPATPATFQGDLSPINAAIAALFTDQESQDAVIESLATVNSGQAEAIAALFTDQESQDAVIESLATVNSGQAEAIAALLARPIANGFTYDQQSEPINPLSGATWRERSSGGLIVGEWQWDSEALRWVEIITRSQLFNVAGTGQNFSPFNVQSGILDPLGTVLYLGFKGVFWINTTANASNYYEQRLMTYQKEPATDSIVGGNSFTLLTPYSAAITVPNTNVPYSVSTKQLISRPGGLIGFRSWVVVVGTPGSFRSIGSVLFKNVRAA